MAGSPNVPGPRTVRGSVSGRVQGVGFRWFALLAARRAGVCGTAENLRDGRVAFVAQGDDADVDRWLEALREGPSGSRVDDLVVEEVASSTSYDTFEIR